MVVPEGTEEMVALAAVDHGRPDHAFYRAGEYVCSGPLYLLAILISLVCPKIIRPRRPCW